MREYKFRAWDNYYQEMINWEQYKTELVSDDFINHGKGPLTIMQYTGIKDKNGKEIYEGDICRWRDLETFNDEILEDIFVVVWNDEKLAWYTQNEDGNFGYDLCEYTDDRDLEVIGNIYENIDLLEVE